MTVLVFKLSDELRRDSAEESQHMSAQELVERWLDLALNTSVALNPGDVARFEWVRQSVLTFGNTLFLEQFNVLRNELSLETAVCKAMARVMPGSKVRLTIPKKPLPGRESDISFEMVLDLPAGGNARNARVSAVLSVADQRVELSS